MAHVNDNGTALVPRKQPSATPPPRLLDPSTCVDTSGIHPHLAAGTAAAHMVTPPGHHSPPSAQTTEQSVIVQAYRWNVDRRKWIPTTAAGDDNRMSDHHHQQQHWLPSIPPHQQIDVALPSTVTPPMDPVPPKPSLILRLPRGGTVWIWRQLLSTHTLQAVRHEMLHKVQYRRYRIQGTYEPRVHALYHAHANVHHTSNGSTFAVASQPQKQPGYRYGQVVLQARPLTELPAVAELAQKLEPVSRQVVLSLQEECDNAQLSLDVEMTQTSDATVPHTRDPQPASASSTGNDNEKDEETFWNIGINPVIYRSREDRIGPHADNDQGESIIVTAIVEGPVRQPRKLVVEPAVCKKKHCHKLFSRQGDDKVPALNDRDEKYELFLRPGDVYQMDGEMQKHYVHSVPRVVESKTRDAREALSNDEPEEQRRMILVLRRGNLVEYHRDAGELVPDPLHVPVKLPYRIGAIDHPPPPPDTAGASTPAAGTAPLLVYGGIYRRRELSDMGAHLMAQRSVSGSAEFGCDAIIISGMRSDHHEWDAFFDVVFAVEYSGGGRALQTSLERRYRIRVFRTSNVDKSILHNVRVAAAGGGDVDGGATGHSSYGTQLYRYDGLYDIAGMKAPAEGSSDPCLFYLRMANPKRLGENLDHDPFTKQAIPSCTPLDTIARPFHFERPRYLQIPRLTKSQFLRILHMDVDRQKKSGVTTRSGNAIRGLFPYFISAVKEGLPIICQMEKERLKEEEVRMEKLKQSRANLERTRPKRVFKARAIRTKHRSDGRLSSRVNFRRFPKLKCNCRQFRCCECGKCSQGWCPKDKCQCVNGPLRLTPPKPRQFKSKPAVVPPPVHVEQTEN